MTRSALESDARRTLRDLDDPRSHEFLDFLDSHQDALWRECGAGHLTASALIVDVRTRRALLMLHAKVGRWLQMGGHCEPLDATLRSAALREAQEESGIAELEVGAAPVCLDRHPVRCAGRDLDHLDVQFLAFAAAGASASGNSESRGLRWVDLDLPGDHAGLGLDGSVVRLLAAARAALD